VNIIDSIRYKEKQFWDPLKLGCCQMICYNILCFPCLCVLGCCNEPVERSWVFQNSGSVVLSQKFICCYCIERSSILRDRLTSVKAVYLNGTPALVEVGLKNTKLREPLRAKTSLESIIDIRVFLWGREAAQLKPEDIISFETDS